MLEDQLRSNFQVNRPKGYTEKEDRFLPRIAGELKHLLIKIQDSHIQNNLLHLPNSKIEELACVLVEFAEDIHNDIGIWKSYEYYNLTFFKTKLPLTLQSNEDMGQNALNEYRLRHLLWVLYSELNPELILSPTNRDLRLMASLISDFLGKIFAKIPQGSGLKRFLTQPNTYGWEVKKKLLWLGQHSYFFRHSFQNYIEANEGIAEIPLIDSFVCHQATSWSGLRVIDILAAALDISKKQRSTIRSWHEKHMAYYKVLAIKDPLIEVMNIINNKPYTVRVGENSRHFKINQLVFGDLAPWNDEWYWSGKQLIYNDLSEKAMQQLKNKFLQKAPHIAYRYCPQQANQAKERINIHYHEFVKYHGQDLVIYPNGHSLVADLINRYRQHNKSLSKGASSPINKKNTRPNPRPTVSLPPQLIESNNGIGVYFNPDEGHEIIGEFNYIVKGFEKKGINLSDDEENSIRSFICSDSVSPRFIKKLIQKYGDESIASVFLIHNSDNKFYLEYLLRRNKGNFFKNRHPSIAFSHSNNW